MAKKTNKGKHLTVGADGSLTWDWDALPKEVQEATASIVTVTESNGKAYQKEKAE
jgi:hypothetical protein